MTYENAMDRLSRLSYAKGRMHTVNDPTRITARSILEARLGRSIGPIRAMPKDTRRAMFLLALQLNKKPVT